jgi:4-diphosphocytidyl-2-C-methyl-D-erythritol kinase
LDKNLVGKAAMQLAAAAGIEATGRIELHKVLPPGGGLGGGSSDAASVLLALNVAWGLHWGTEKLEAIAAELGSDVPFFVGARAALCTGRGEIMTPLSPRHLLFAVLIIPPRGCPTKEVYQAFDAGHRENDIGRTDWKALAMAEAKALNEMLVNDLARGAFHVAPWLEELRDRAAASVGQKVHVTGSGSTLFTLAGSSVEADEITARLTAALPEDHGIIPARIVG